MYILYASRQIAALYPKSIPHLIRFAKSKTPMEQDNIHLEE